VVTTRSNSIGRTVYVTTDLPSSVYSPHLSYGPLPQLLSGEIRLRDAEETVEWAGA
jgi:hypothetical protein